MTLRGNKRASTRPPGGWPGTGTYRSFAGTVAPGTLLAVERHDTYGVGLREAINAAEVLLLQR
eukprot:5530391-Pleurochrysis_carterae.AAC.1